MKRLKPFRTGGIFLDHSSAVYEPGQNAFLPNRAIVPLRQHAGSSCRCVVRPGDVVKEGMVVGRSDGKRSANVHSPVPGIVREIRKTAQGDGDTLESVVISLDGAFEQLGRKTEYLPWKMLTKNELLHIVHDKGVVETDLGYAPFFDRLMDAQGRHDDYLVINAVENLETSNTEMTALGDKPAEIIEGIEIIKKILGITQAYMATTARDSSIAESLLAKACGDRPVPEILSAAAKFPQEHPSKLADSCKATIGSGSPFISSASTALAVFEAVANNKPMLERYVSLSGGAIKRPATLKVRIGTPIGDLIEECGGFKGAPEFIVINGPFSGFSVFDLDTPVTKITKSISALTKSEVMRSIPTECIRCGACVEVCPESLEPFRLYKLIRRGELRDDTKKSIDLCIECGACGFACPSRVPLVHAIVTAKRDLGRTDA